MSENELDADLERAMRENVNLEQYDDIPPSKSQWPGDETRLFHIFEIKQFIVISRKSLNIASKLIHEMPFYVLFV